MTTAEFTTEELALAENRPSAKRLYYRSWYGIAAFFQQQLQITTKSVGTEAKIPLVPNPVQLPVLKDDIEQLRTRGYIRDLIAKCRQPGGSTYASAWVWNRVSLFDGIYAFIVAQDLGTVKRIYSMHDVFYKNMGQDIRPSLKSYSTGSEMVLGEPGDEDTGLESRLLVGEAKNIHLGVGRTIHCLHMSEICRYPSSDPIKEALIPACSDAPGTVRIIESTAHFGGGADWFHYQCDKAIADKKKGRYSEYHFHFLEWWRLKEYSMPLEKGEKLKFNVDERAIIKQHNLTHENIKWRRKQLDEFEGDINSFYLSYPMDYEEMWITRESSAFSQERLKELHAMLKPPIKRFRIEEGQMYEHDQGELAVWTLPQPGKIYDAGADIGGGHSDGDWSVVQVIERGTNIQVAEYRARILPCDFTPILAKIGHFYNTAQLGPEVNNFGLEVIVELNKTYPNIYLWRKQDKLVPKMTGDLGWDTQYQSKLIMVGLANKRIYHRQVQIFSKVLWNELHYFGRDYTDTGKITYRAITGHDDTAMAWMIALKISDDECFGEMSQDIAPTPKEESRDPATYDSEWDKVLSGRIDQDMITGSWPD